MHVSERPLSIQRPSGDGTLLWVLGDKYTFKVTGADSREAFLCFEILARPGSGPPLHTHRKEAETFYVLEGQVEFVLDGTTRVYGPGACVFFPIGAQHTFKVIGNEPARLLVMCAPAGLERFFAAIGAPILQEDEAPPPVTDATIERLLALAPEYGLEIAPPA